MISAGKAYVPGSLPTTSGRNAASALVPRSSARTQWAVRGAVSDVHAEFERLRPGLAHHFPFELDGFQKEAVIHLEQVTISAAKSTACRAMPACQASSVFKSALHSACYIGILAD